MPRTTSLQLSPADLAQLDQLAAEMNTPAIRSRVDIIRLLHAGHTPTEVAAMQGVSRDTIYQWRARYQTDGIHGLTDKPRSGRPRKVDSHAQTLLEAALAETPDDMGFDETAGWTVKLLCDYLKRETGLTLSQGRMHVLLHRLGYQFQAVPSLRDQLMPPLPTALSQVGEWLAMWKTLNQMLPKQYGQRVKSWVKTAPDGPEND